MRHRQPVGSTRDRPGSPAPCGGRPIRRSRAGQVGPRRTATEAAARCRPRRGPRTRRARCSSSPASSGVSRMPTRLDAVAAQSAPATLPRAIEVNAIEDCTVDGSTHSTSSPAHSAGVSSPGAIARAASPSAGNNRNVLASTTACSRQCRAPANAACGANRAPCRKNISAIAAVPAPLATAMPRPSAGGGSQRHHAQDAGDVGIEVQPGEQRLVDMARRISGLAGYCEPRLIAAYCHHEL